MDLLVERANSNSKDLQTYTFTMTVPQGRNPNSILYYSQYYLAAASMGHADKWASISPGHLDFGWISSPLTKVGKKLVFGWKDEIVTVPPEMIKRASILKAKVHMTLYPSLNSHVTTISYNHENGLQQRSIEGPMSYNEHRNWETIADKLFGHIIKSKDIKFKDIGIKELK